MTTLTVGSIWLLTIGATANIDRGENRLEHAALCSLVALTDGSLEAPVIPPIDKGTYQLIQNLNFSTSPKAWQDSFYQGGNTEKVHTDAQAYHKAYKGYEDYWNDWQDAATAVGAKTKEAKLKESGALELDGRAKQYAHTKIRSIALRARKIWRASTSSTSEAAEFNAATELKKLKKAIYGTETSSRNDATTDGVFNGDPGNSRNTACDAAVGTGKATTVAAQLACVCLKNTASNAVGVCTDKADGPTGWAAGATKFQDGDVQAVLKTCPSGKGAAITATKIRAAAEAVRSLLSSVSGNAYLGKFKNTNCDGTSGNGICVAITGYDADPTAGFNKLGWPQTLHAIAKALEDREAAAVLAAQTNKLLEEEAGKAMDVVKEAREATTTAESGQTRQQPEPRKEEKDRCSKHNSNGTCTPDNNCKWEEKDGKGEYCKPKDGEGQKT
uniref:Variant surface glycoprotein 1125.1250 n=1 Tax=Trypanosoma brucei TaxID=5691 RepID=A0A1J0R6J0_9TRYP|nr:variant surface glycoprotein 1125.1250 [Trypanosoma brucei]